MLLTLLQSGPCEGVLMYTIDQGEPIAYTEPVVIEEGSSVTIEFPPLDGAPNPCCLQYRDFGTHGENENPYTFVVDKDDMTVTAIVDRCGDEPCTPRYRDVRTLVSKANCICTNIGVQVIPICPMLPGGPQAFIVYDKCTPEDPQDNPFGLGFHVIMGIADPNYLLQTIECICGGRSDPEYLPLANPN